LDPCLSVSIKFKKKELSSANPIGMDHARISGRQLQPYPCLVAPCTPADETCTSPHTLHLRRYTTVHSWSQALPSAGTATRLHELHTQRVKQDGMVGMNLQAATSHPSHCRYHHRIPRRQRVLWRTVATPAPKCTGHTHTL
jgi:hypothetical protein